MAIEKAKISDNIYSVITPEEYYKNPDSYRQYTAVKSDGLLYPVRTGRVDMSKPGFYSDGNLHHFVHPQSSDVAAYTESNIIDFSNANNIRELIQAQQKLMREERYILTTIDDVFIPEISESDTPEMKALKEAIQCKHIDLDKYEQRFGPNYNNDKRLLKKNSITFGKLRTIADALDIKVTVTIEDMSPDVPNPIGKTITTQINYGLGSSEDEEEEA